MFSRKSSPGISLVFIQELQFKPANNFWLLGGHLTGQGPGFAGQDTSLVGQKKEKRKRE